MKDKGSYSSKKTHRSSREYQVEGCVGARQRYPNKAGGATRRYEESGLTQGNLLKEEN